MFREKPCIKKQVCNQLKDRLKVDLSLHTNVCYVQIHTTCVSAHNPPSPRSAPDPFGTPHAQLWKLLSRDALGPLPGGSLARPTQASCLLLQCWSQRGGGGLSLLPLALWRLPAVAWGRVSLFPGGGGDEHRRRPPGGATWSLESAERIGTPGWVVLRLRTRCDCRPLAMLCWRRCYVITVR